MKLIPICKNMNSRLVAFFCCFEYSATSYFDSKSTLSGLQPKLMSYLNKATHQKWELVTKAKFSLQVKIFIFRGRISEAFVVDEFHLHFKLIWRVCMLYNKEKKKRRNRLQPEPSISKFGSSEHFLNFASRLYNCCRVEVDSEIFFRKVCQTWIKCLNYLLY